MSRKIRSKGGTPAGDVGAWPVARLVGAGAARRPRRIGERPSRNRGIGHFGLALGGRPCMGVMSIPYGAPGDEASRAPPAGLGGASPR